MNFFEQGRKKILIIAFLCLAALFVLGYFFRNRFNFFGPDKKPEEIFDQKQAGELDEIRAKLNVQLPDAGSQAKELDALKDQDKTDYTEEDMGKQAEEMDRLKELMEESSNVQ
ncbi:MAG: hypothetical protein PHQ47_01225 [Candidatus Portnoybacteria bacterium]|nr:hypothetical protein [Candidatus Portnoybacteria bacterium]